MNAKGIFVKWIVLWCCLVGQPGGAQGAQGVPSGAGSLDARFFAAMGVDPIWDGSPTVRRIVPQPDGQVWIDGGFDQVQGFPRRGLARLNPDGSLDATFVPSAFRGDPTVQTLLCQPDGKLLAGGSFGLLDGSWTAVVRLNTDGSLDTTFRTATPGYAEGRLLLLQPDGKIIVDGKWRLNPDGSRDYAFFTSDDGAGASAAALLPNGDLLVTGNFTAFEQWPRPSLVRLLGGDAPAAGFFEFVETYFNANEDAGPALVRVRRVGATNEAATVEYATADVTAKAGIDYAAAIGTLHFAPGELEETISISIIPNDTYQGERMFNVVLRDTTPGDRAPSTSDASVIIIDNDPGLTFSQTEYDVYGGSITTRPARGIFTVSSCSARWYCYLPPFCGYRR